MEPVELICFILAVARDFLLSRAAVGHAIADQEDALAARRHRKAF